MSAITVVPSYPEIGKKEYMERFEPFFSARQMRLLRAAYAFSKEGHRLQTRDSGRRYFDHVRACSWIAINELQLHDFELHLALLLHDIVEDTYLLTIESIEMFFGEDIAIMVNLLTHREAVSTERYVQNIRESGRNPVIMAKLVDRLHNLRTLGDCPAEKQAKQTTETREFYYPLADFLVSNIASTHLWRAEHVRDQIHQAVDRWSTNGVAAS